MAPRLPPSGPRARPLHRAATGGEQGVSLPPLSPLLLPHLGPTRPAGSRSSLLQPEHRRVLCCRFEEALQEARQVDKLLSEAPADDCLEEKFPLLGVPVTVKEAFSLYGGFIFVSLQVLTCSPQWWVAVAGAWREVVSLSLVCSKLCLGFCVCVHL